MCGWLVGGWGGVGGWGAACAMFLVFGSLSMMFLVLMFLVFGLRGCLGWRVRFGG